MTTADQPRRRFPAGTFALVLLALPLYVVMVANLAGSRGSDAMGGALAGAYGAIAGAVLWLLIAAMLISAFVRGRMPRWAGIALIVVFPLAAFGCLLAGTLYVEQGGWLLAVPAVLPLLPAGYALWTRFRNV